MTLQTRKPTGVTPWPFILIAGVEKSGKSWACAEASASPVVGRTIWISVGEDDPDEYANIPGANFEIAQHDGSYRSILDTVIAASKEPLVDGKPNLLVFDSATRLWELIKSDMEAIQVAKLRKFNKPIPDDIRLTMDLWNLANQRWDHVIETLRQHRGPVLITSRLNSVSVMDNNGNPTKDKELKVDAQKSLPFEVTGVIQLRARGDIWITGLRSTRFPLTEPTEYRDFTVNDLWNKLGVGQTTMGERAHAHVRVTGDDQPAAQQPREQVVQNAPVHLAPEPVESWWTKRLAGITDSQELQGFYNDTKAATDRTGIPDDYNKWVTARLNQIRSQAA